MYCNAPLTLGNCLVNLCQEPALGMGMVVHQGSVIGLAFLLMYKLQSITLVIYYVANTIVNYATTTTKKKLYVVLLSYYHVLPPLLLEV